MTNSKDEKRFTSVNDPGFWYHYDKRLGAMGGATHGEPTVQGMTVLLNTLDHMLTHFNELILIPKRAEEMAAFVAHAKKFVKKAAESDDPLVRHMAQSAEIKIAMLELGMKKGKLTPEEIERATAAAKELEEKLRGMGTSGPIVARDEREKV